MVLFILVARQEELLDKGLFDCLRRGNMKAGPPDLISQVAAVQLCACEALRKAVFVTGVALNLCSVRSLPGSAAN